MDKASELVAIGSMKEAELTAYNVYLKTKRPPLAPSVRAQLYSLFLQGQSCEEIQRLNPGFHLGSIIQARVEDDWDKKLHDYQLELMTKVRSRVQQVALETVERVANEIAASNKLVNDRVKRFLQTGDEEELKGLSLGSSKHLKEMVEMLQKLTGQGTDKHDTLDVRHTIVEEKEVIDLPKVAAGEPIEPKTAAAVLAAVHASRQKR